jgi:NitT/TauT family transport system substrate-binding protein
MRDVIKLTANTAGGIDRRHFLAGTGAAVGGLALFGLSACGDSGGGVDAGQKNQQAVTHLDEIISPAPFHIAQQEGMFKQAGLNLESISFPGGADVIRAIQTKMPFGLGATIATMIAFDKGFPDVRMVGGMFNSSEVLFMVPSDSPIEKPEDLDGKKIGVSEPGSNTTYFGNLLIDRYKLQGAKITYVGGPSDAITAAEKGVVDVGWSSPPFSTQLVDEGKARVLIDTRKLEPHWATVLLVSKQGVIDENKKTVDAWVGALGKAVDMIHSDVERAGQAWANGIGIKPKIATKALQDYEDAFTLDLDLKTLDSAQRAGKSLDQIDGDVDFDTLVDDQTKNL